MDALKNLLNTFARPYLAKVLTRLALYGAAAVTARLAVAAPSNDTVAQVVDWSATAILAGVAALIDYLHHRADTGRGPVSDNEGESQCQ